MGELDLKIVEVEKPIEVPVVQKVPNTHSEKQPDWMTDPPEVFMKKRYLRR